MTWPWVKSDVQVVSTDSTKILILADKDPHIVADQRAGQQVGLAQDLKAVADAEHRHPGSAALITSVMTGESRDGAAAQVVPIGEPAGQNPPVRRRGCRCRATAARARPAEPDGAERVLIVEGLER